MSLEIREQAGSNLLEVHTNWRLAGSSRPFTEAENRLSTVGQIEEARQWLRDTPRAQSA